jgi:hypothetical protein
MLLNLLLAAAFLSERLTGGFALDGSALTAETGSELWSTNATYASTRPHICRKVINGLGLASVENSPTGDLVSTAAR